MTLGWLRRALPIALLFAGNSVSLEAADVDRRIQSAIEILRHVPTGKELLVRATHFWGLQRPQELEKKLKWGEASKTDAVLTRHFNPRTGTESRERQVTIYLRQAQTLDDLVLDIAHELVHATSKPGWDPYDPRLTAGKYIFAAIEGEGGEVQAVATECQVGFEIHERFGAAISSAHRCNHYMSQSSEQLEPELIRRDFYRVGRWEKDLAHKLGAEKQHFPLLSAEPPKLYSSTGNAPYPVALYHEFEEITQIACENSRRRAHADVHRAPASVRQNAAVFVSKRCEKERL